jgi:hypothetical protein
MSGIHQILFGILANVAEPFLEAKAIPLQALTGLRVPGC